MVLQNAWLSRANSAIVQGKWLRVRCVCCGLRVGYYCGRVCARNERGSVLRQAVHMLYTQIGVMMMSHAQSATWHQLLRYVMLFHDGPSCPGSADTQEA